MSAFDEEEFDIDMAIEQYLFDDGMDSFPPPQSVGQPALQQTMPSWMGMGRVIVPYDLAFGHKQVHGSNSIEFTWPSMQLFVSKQC
jgi:hypothetical protein